MGQKYKLTYFDVKGLGEPIRWMFAYAKVNYEDERIPWDYPKWFMETKKEFDDSFGQMPVLTIDNEITICQSMVITQYLAKEFGFNAETSLEEARSNEVACAIFDLFINWRWYALLEKDETRRAFLKPRLDGRFKLVYSKINKMLETSKSGYVAGGKGITHGDFWLASLVNVWDDFVEGVGPIAVLPFMKETISSENDYYPDLSKEYPALRAHKEMMLAIPQIEEWVEKRPKTIA